MKITFYGTRGSSPVAGPGFEKYGGRTTCLRIDSNCLQKDQWLAIDAGSGALPLAQDALKSGVKDLCYLFTHYHWDHIQGLPLALTTFKSDLPITCIGPVDNGIDPLMMLKVSMAPPFFPVDFHQVASHFRFLGITKPASEVIIIHPEIGLRFIDTDEFEKAEQSKQKQLQFTEGGFRISECLVIRMHYTHHPERTISYRFEERPTGKVFTFVTDHENTDGIAPPFDMIKHLACADLLVMDCQYTRAKYDLMTNGFGHGTPDFCANVAHKVNAKQLGLTHHDPSSLDSNIEEITEMARRYAATECGYEGDIFACADDVTIVI